MSAVTVPHFELTRGDVLFRLQRRLGLLPAEGAGLLRRALFWSMLGWLPIAVWSAVTHRALAGAAGEPLLAHFGVHARLLVAVPLLILAEGPVNALTALLLRYFSESGLVPDERQAALSTCVQRVLRLRDANWPWALMLAAALALGSYSQAMDRSHEVDWAATGPGELGFGGYWYLYVGRTIFLVLVFGWIWRIALLTILLARIARLGLALVPTHPDRAAGLGILERLPAAFAPVALAVSVVLAARWGHDVVYHGLTLASIKAQMILFIVLCATAFCLPALAFVGPMKRARQRALLDYGMLIGRQGRLLHRRWIEGCETGAQPLLDAPELGSAADTAALYGAVRAMRTVPFGVAALVPVAVAAALPMVALMALKMPVAEILGKLLHAVL